MEKNLDSNSNSDSFEYENFKVKKMEIIEKITRKSQASGSSGPSDGNLMNMMVKIMEVIYNLISFCILFLFFGYNFNVI